MNKSTSVFVELQQIWDTYGDLRTSQWFFTANLYPTICLIVIYLVIVQIILPQIFKNKKYEKLQNILTTYYFIHSAISLAYVLVGIYYWPFKNFRCDPTIKTFDGEGLLAAHISYSWLLFKFSEMIETFLMIIVCGRAPIFNKIHHSLHPFLLTIFIHFYAGGSPLFFGFINNLEHAALYFVVALRMLSQTFKKRSNWWFKKFHIIISVGALWVSIFFFLQLEKRDDCDFEIVRVPILFALFLFVFLSIYFRWSYISHHEAFGQSAIVMYINGKSRLNKSGDGM